MSGLRRHLTRYWQGLRVTQKFSLLFGLLTALLIASAVTAYLVFAFIQRQTETMILTSLEIQRLVLEMDRSLEKARRLQRDFFLHYPELGLAEARDRYAEAVVMHVAGVVDMSSRLQRLIGQPEIGSAIKENRVDLNLFLATTTRFGETFLQSLSLITEAAEETSGREAELEANAVWLATILESSSDPILIDRYRQMRLAEKEYLIKRQRHLMQSVLNQVFLLSRMVENTSSLPEDRQLAALVHLNNYRAMAEQTADLDRAIRSRVNEFNLQAETIDPAVSNLIRAAGADVLETRRQIDQLVRRAAVILFLIALIGVVLVLAVGRLWHLSISRNLTRLTETARQMQYGNLRVKAEVDSRDEIGQLAEAFNAMVTEIGSKVSELESSRQIYRRLFEDSHDPITLATPDGGIIDINQAGVVLFGYPLETMKQFKPKDLYIDEREWQAFIGRLTEAGYVSGFETRLRRSDGRVMEVVMNTTVQKAEDGRILFLQTIVRDITEQKAREAENRRLQQQLDGIINSMPSTIIGIDAEFRVTHWNERAAENTGISADSARGEIVTEVCPILKKEKHLIRQALKDRQARQHNKVARQTDRQLQYADITVYPLSTDGHNGVVVRIDDVTDRVRMEELMIQTEKMMSVGGLAAGMAHEINNPLGGILQGTQNIRRRLSAELKANQSAAEQAGIDLAKLADYLRQRNILDYLDGIETAGKRAAHIITNMLQFSRRSESRMAPTDLNQLLEKVIELAGNDYDLKKRFDFRQIELERQFDPSLPLVACTQTEIEQVILNLLRNAAQAMSGPDQKQQPRIHLRTQYENDAARIEVEDNGPGMTEEVRRRAFEPFYTTKPVGQGTGLGLSVSYMIITHNHNGTIEVQSKPSQGARFIIHLPVKAAVRVAGAETGD
jgi:PAS domain S-box-containing protein